MLSYLHPSRQSDQSPQTEAATSSIRTFIPSSQNILVPSQERAANINAKQMFRFPQRPSPRTGPQGGGGVVLMGGNVHLSTLLEPRLVQVVPETMWAEPDRTGGLDRSRKSGLTDNCSLTASNKPPFPF